MVKSSFTSRNLFEGKNKIQNHKNQAYVPLSVPEFFDTRKSPDRNGPGISMFVREIV